MSWFSRTPTVSAGQARDLVAAGAVLVDVREKDEWNGGHAPEALHLPLSRIDEAHRRLDPNATFVVVCRSGHRSKAATTRMRAAGLEASSLSGGMSAWSAAGGTVVDRNGRRTA